MTHNLWMVESVHVVVEVRWGLSKTVRPETNARNRSHRIDKSVGFAIDTSVEEAKGELLRHRKHGGRLETGFVWPVAGPVAPKPYVAFSHTLLKELLVALVKLTNSIVGQRETIQVREEAGLLGSNP